MAEAEAEEYKFTIWLDAPHDQVWRAIRQQIEHPRTGEKSGIKQIVVIEQKKNLLVREVVPARGKRFQEKITFISNQKAITESSRGPYESVVQMVAREKNRTRISFEFRPRKFTRWILRLKRWVKRAPLDLDDLLQLNKMPKPQAVARPTP
jgi:hypothetical protein